MFDTIVCFCTVLTFLCLLYGVFWYASRITAWAIREAAAERARRRMTARGIETLRHGVRECLRSDRFHIETERGAREELIAGWDRLEYPGRPGKVKS